MAKTYGLSAVILWAVLALIVGGIITYSAFPKEVTVQVDRPVPYPVEKIVEKEVLKTVEVDRDYTGQLIQDFLYKLENDEDFDNVLICDKERYDFDQLSINRVYDRYSVTMDNIDTDDAEEVETYTTSAKVRLKFSDPDVEDKCYKTLTVTGKYTDGEPNKITYK